jgi:UDP:flavonoid glycosyltransferase YjiC (YdhE family)
VLRAIARKTRRGAERFLIFCSMGTIHANYDYFKRVIAAVSDKPDRDLILTIGHDLSPADFEPIPENVYLLPRVPQLDLLKRADIVITHGGIEGIFIAIRLPKLLKRSTKCCTTLIIEPTWIGCS